MTDDSVKLAVHAHGATAAHRVGALRPPRALVQAPEHGSRRALVRAPEHGSKRAFDIVVSVLGLVCLVGVFAIIALLIKLDSPGPVFYRVRRVGYRGRPLRMLKFRKM